MKSAAIVAFLTFLSAPVFAQGNDPQQGQIAPELVGKWCYIKTGSSTLDEMSNSCITLNGDGTYELNLERSLMINSNSAFQGLQEADSGTWWVKDGWIYYNSSSQGKGSMRYEKVNHPRIESTPTIVLNGIIFCPASPRDPW